MKHNVGIDHEPMTRLTSILSMTTSSLDRQDRLVSRIRGALRASFIAAWDVRTKVSFAQDCGEKLLAQVFVEMRRELDLTLDNSALLSLLQELLLSESQIFTRPFQNRDLRNREVAGHNNDV
jgi:hypothetical protein